MTAWKPIPKAGYIDHDDCILVRRPRAGGRGWQFEIAYQSVGAGWRVANGGASVSAYKEWARIPD